MEVRLNNKYIYCFQKTGAPKGFRLQSREWSKETAKHLADQLLLAVRGTSRRGKVLMILGTQMED